jgi:prepilin-type N-terminal cleavage/methylation domain-containing protein/prepilin-type processing-associated H-X9-DG protein
MKLPLSIRAKRRNGFTLIELLVVISIISVLISMLLPTLSSSRTVAMKVKCAGNLRQITSGHLAYALENRGWFPTAYAVTQAGITPSITGRNPLEAGYWGADARLFLCPDSKFVGTNIGYAPARWWGGLNMLITSYRFSASSNVSTQSWMWYGAHPGAPGLQTTRIDDRVSVNIPREDFAGRVMSDPVYPANRRYVHPPDMMPMVMDGRNNASTLWFVYTSLGAMTNNHTTLNGINVTFVDGHAQWGDQATHQNRTNIGYAGGESGWMRW